MEEKIVILRPMTVLFMTAAAGYGQKAGAGTTAQATVESMAVDTTATDTATDTTQADATGTETIVVAQSDDSYQYVSVKDVVAAVKDENAHVLNVREQDNYVKRGAVNSVWCSVFLLEDDSLVDVMNTHAEENLNDRKKIYIIRNSGKGGTEKATGVPKETGTGGSLTYTMEGGARALESEKGAFTTNRIDEDIDWKMVTAVDVLRAVGGNDVQILDVRDNDTYVGGHLKGSLQCPLEGIENPTVQTIMYKMVKEEMDPSKPVYLLCYSGNKCVKTGISVTEDAGFDVDNLLIIENGAKDKDIQTAFVTEQDNPSGDMISPDRVA